MAAKIVRDQRPPFRVQTQRRSKIPCPNCQEEIVVDAKSVDRGYTIECHGCGQKTYYPFDRPLRMRGKILGVWIFWGVITFSLGIASTAAYNYLTVEDCSGSQKQEVN